MDEATLEWLGLREAGKDTNQSESAETIGHPVHQAHVVPAGSRIYVRLDDYLDSGRSEVNDRFSMTVSEPVPIDERVVIPMGAAIEGTVVEVDRAQRPQKGGKLVLRPDSVQLDLAVVPVEGQILAVGKSLEGKSSSSEDLKEIGIAAGLGAALGGLIKGKKGALAGVLIGGTGAFLGTKGEEVRLDPETELAIELLEPLTVRVE